MRVTGPVTFLTMPAGVSDGATMGLLSRTKIIQSAGSIRLDASPLLRSRPPLGSRQAAALCGGCAVDRQYRRTMARARLAQAGIFPTMHEAVPPGGLAPWDKLIGACRHHIGMLFSCLRNWDRTAIR